MATINLNFVELEERESSYLKSRIIFFNFPTQLNVPFFLCVLHTVSGMKHIIMIASTALPHDTAIGTHNQQYNQTRKSREKILSRIQSLTQLSESILIFLRMIYLQKWPSRWRFRSPNLRIFRLSKQRGKQVDIPFKNHSQNH